MTQPERDQRREAVLQEFRDSGMTQKAFCKDRELPISTLQYWLGRERKRSISSNGTELVPIATVSTTSPGRLLRVIVGDGVSIEVERPVGEAELATILRAIGSS
jgi:hypothetical protein